MVSELYGPLCSVVTPAYNAEAFVGEAIASALAQTYRPLEIIVVNDGSTDATAEVLAGFGSQITVLEQENAGPSRARNRGVAAARGEVVAFLDADDLWEPTRIARCVELLDGRPDLGMIVADAFLIEGGVRTPHRVYRDRYPAPFPEPDRQLYAVAQQNFFLSSVLVRRSLFEAAGGFDESLWRSEDYDLWMRLLLTGARAGYVDEPLGCYRVRDDGLSSNVPAMWITHLLVLERHLPALRRHGVQVRAGIYFEIARRAVQRGDTLRGLRFGVMGLGAADLSYARRLRAFAAVVRDALRRPRVSVDA
jgi:glycosyltransferase involved in cell wall biosynthesis